jgi:preprotein translocase subunit SecE
VARDRQRAKQRKARRAGQNPGPERSEPRRANVPGELDHASGEADEFDAALVAGAGGRAQDDELDDRPSDDRPDDDRVADEDDVVADAGAPAARQSRDLDDDELLEDEDDVEDAELERQAVAAGGRRGDVAAAERPAAPSKGGPARFLAFLRASWAELQRVQWPDRRQVFQATAVVIGFVIVAGLYLGLADRVAQELVDFII